MGSFANLGNEKIEIVAKKRNRRSKKIIDVLAITTKGTGQILEMNNRGLSFGCLYPHSFPHVFHIDLLSAQGSHIKKVKVKKTTEKTKTRRKKDVFEVIVGVEFTDLSHDQMEKLNNLFAKDLL